MTSRIVLRLGKMLETILDMIRIIIWKIKNFFQLGVFHMCFTDPSPPTLGVGGEGSYYGERDVPLRERECERERER